MKFRLLFILAFILESCSLSLEPQETIDYGIPEVFWKLKRKILGT